MKRPILHYDYDELKERALSPDATNDDIKALGKWFEKYGDKFWNGEYYEIDSKHRLYPVYRNIMDDDWVISRYTIENC